MKPDVWIRRTHLFGKDEYICTACRAVCDKPYKTCPNCGTEKRSVEYNASWVDEAAEMSIMLGEDW